MSTILHDIDLRKSVFRNNSFFILQKVTFAQWFMWYRVYSITQYWTQNSVHNSEKLILYPFEFLICMQYYVLVCKYVGNKINLQDFDEKFQRKHLLEDLELDGMVRIKWSLRK